MKRLLSFTSLLFLFGCSSPGKFYESLPHGQLSGELNLQWRDHPTKTFVYIPNPDNPLRYVTSTGDVITPGALYTDGGSIPRVVSLDKHFVPWKFGPAYIIHDWIFELHDCGQNEDGKYNHENAAEIMAEVIKTQFVQAGREPTLRERIAIWEIYGFTRSFSKGIWFSDSAECEVPPAMEISTKMMDENEMEHAPMDSLEDTPENEPEDLNKDSETPEAGSMQNNENASDEMLTDDAGKEGLTEDSSDGPKPVPYTEILKQQQQAESL